MGTAVKERQTTGKYTTDEETKRRATEVYGNLGMSLSTAINVFLHQSVAVGGMPFRPCEYPEPHHFDLDKVPKARVTDRGTVIAPAEWRDADDDDDEW